MVVPRLIALDSSTLGNLARDCATQPDARKVLDLLNVGSVVLFVTWHHIEELIQHKNPDVYRERLAFLGRLKLVSYPKLPWDIGDVGSFIELMAYEIRDIFQDPSASLETIISRVRSQVTNGFSSGANLCRANAEFWDYYRQNLASDSMQKKAEIASLTHFSVVDRKQKIPDVSEYKTPLNLAEAKRRSESLAEVLAIRLEKGGDPRAGNHDKIARDLMLETYNDVAEDVQKTGDLTESMRRVYGVDPARLPKNARIEDAGYEAIFVKHLGLHARRLLIPYNELYRKIRQENLPSWIVWREIDRRIQQLPKAEAGNINDLFIASFGSYVDYIQVDKRIADLIRQASQSQPLLKAIHTKLVRFESYAQLTEFLEAQLLH